MTPAAESLPDVEPGNEFSLTHGAYSERRIAQRAAEVHDALLDVALYRAEPKFMPAVSRYLQAAAREALLHGHIAVLAAGRGPGAVPSRTREQANAAARWAARLGSDLGLDPVGHARIRSLVAGAEATESTLADLAVRGAEPSGFRQREKSPPGCCRSWSSGEHRRATPEAL